MSANKPTKAASMIAEVYGQWFSACLQPWSGLCTWNAYWGDRWKVWLTEIGSAPNLWLPALASDRHDQPVSIDFFLPWLPKLEAIVGSHGAIGEKDAQRVMLRAALPHIGSSNEVSSDDAHHVRKVHPRSADKTSGGDAMIDAGGRATAVAPDASPVDATVKKARMKVVEKAAIGAKPAAKRKSATAKPKATASAASAAVALDPRASDATKRRS